MSNRKKKYVIIFFLAVVFSELFFSSELYPEKFWNLYFTSPGCRENMNNERTSPEKALVSLISSARKSFYGAFYEISSPKISRAMAEACRRGVAVRLVIESDNINDASPEIKKMFSEGAAVMDNSKGLMHNKFAVIDDEILWTGSYNLTESASIRNNNNALEIHSSDLAGVYRDEFMEMFENKIFGNKKEYEVFSLFRKKNHIKAQGTDIYVFFSPEDNIEEIILKRIKKAGKSIHFMAFSFTSGKISDAMIDVFKKGVKVSGIIEKDGSDSRYSEYIKMKIEGIPVRLDKNRFIMHHKVIIIDGETLITGSYNFSKNANESNDENILIIENRDISELFLTEFNKLYY